MTFSLHENEVFEIELEHLEEKKEFTPGEWCLGGHWCVEAMLAFAHV